MIIKKLKLQNFKKFESKDFDFNNLIEVYGKNGEGKSTIRDAIIFALYGRTSEGSSSDSTKYISDGKSSTAVTITFERNGEIHSIKRERAKSQTRISYIDGSQNDEDSAVAQRDIDSIIPPYELFQSIFNVGYFMNLSDKDKRTFLLKLTPDIDRKKIYLDLGGNEEFIKKYSFYFRDINAEYSKLLLFKREAFKSLEYTKVCLLNSKKINIPKAKIENPSEEIVKFEEKKKLFNETNQRWDDYNRLLDKNGKIVENNKQIELLIDKLNLTKVNEPSNEILNKLIKKRNDLKPTLSIPEEKCPTCFQDINPLHKNKVNEVNAIRSKSIAENESSIRTETEKYNSEMEKRKKYLYNLSEKNNLERRIEQPIKNEKPNIEKIPFSPSLGDELRKKEIEFHKEQQTISLLTSQETDRKRKEKELIETRDKLALDIKEIDGLLPIFDKNGIPSEEMRLKIDPIIKEVRKKLPNSEIKLLETLKNGLSEKEVFNLVVDGIEYSKCSTGEKMKVSIAISQVIDALSGGAVGIYFIDNAETISGNIITDKQTFICRVNNNKLKICNI